jgi:hypothetical protein
MNHKRQWPVRGISMLAIGGAATLLVQGRIPLSHAARSGVLILWVLLFYGLLGILSNAAIRKEEIEDSKMEPPILVRIESPIEKVGGQVRPRNFAAPDTYSLQDDPAEKEVS